MVVLHLTQQGASLHKRSRCLTVEYENETLAEVPIIKVERVAVFGNITVTTPAVGLLLDEGIDVAFLTLHGELRGRLVGRHSKNVFQRLGQDYHFRHEETRLKLTTRLIATKLKNCRRVLQRVGYRREGLTLDDTLNRLEVFARRAEESASRASLRGVEGHAAHEYFSGFSRALTEPFSFERRSRRPPEDPVNAMLSFGYTVLASDLEAALESVGLDPYVGFYHDLKYGRPALVFDVEELFRHPVVDGLILDIAAHRRLGLEHFEPHEGGIYLNEEGRKLFLRYYETRLGGMEDEKQNFRKAMFTQAENLARVASGTAEFEPYVYH